MSRYTQAWLLLLFVWLGITTELRAQTVEYIHTDALGSPVAVTNAAGVVVERTEYAPYGEQLNRAEDDGPGYTGHVADKTTGLNYMQQRYYDPGIGRFLSVDPVTVDGATGGNFNRYWYANNNPYRFTDPDGRRSREDFAFERIRRLQGEDSSARRDVTANEAIQAIYPEAVIPAIRLVRAISTVAQISQTPKQSQQAKGEPHAPGDAPDGTVIVRGGTGDMPTPGTVFSGSQGRTIEEAAKGVPHGTVRTSTAADVRASGGRVEVAPEAARSGQMNGQHVNVTEGAGNSTFSAPRTNPVPKPDRIQ